MGDSVIIAENISKRYRLGTSKQQAETLSDQVFDLIKSPFTNFKKLRNLSKFSDNDDKSVFWALRDVNFEVKRGEILGIVGHNGAGKSTLLKILSRITEPTSGQIQAKGKISSLLEVGTGFHPELTGRENIYMNGTILGMRKREIDQKLDEIIAFSGITDHIDTAVKFYSSGMKVRLGFSVAAHLEPDILIIDEVLAVGDFEFQKKCISKMSDVAKSGRTIIFVSHDMGAISLLCTKGMYLKKGQVNYFGEIDKTIKHYFSTQSTSKLLTERTDREGNQSLKFGSLDVVNSRGELTLVVNSGESVSFKLNYVRNKNVNPRKLLVSLNIHDATSNALITYLASDELGFRDDFLLKDEGDIYFNVENLMLRGGSYYISIYSSEIEYAGSADHKIDCITHAIEFDVLPVDFWNTGKVNRRKGVLMNATITSKLTDAVFDT